MSQNIYANEGGVTENQYHIRSDGASSPWQPCIPLHCGKCPSGLCQTVFLGDHGKQENREHVWRYNIGRLFSMNSLTACKYTTHFKHFKKRCTN